MGTLAGFNRSYLQIRRAQTVYSCLFAVLIVTSGPWIFQRVMHIDTAGNQMLFSILGTYFVANTWTHLFYMTMMGLRDMWKVATMVSVENLLMVLFGIILVLRLGVSGMALAYLCASVVLPVWLLPRLMAKTLERISGCRIVGTPLISRNWTHVVP
jgi:hypothetical protein